MPTVDLTTPERGCQWNFTPGINFSEGPTDAAGQNFKNSWETLIRESIQNSLDAVKDRSNPVTVKFEFKRFPARNYKEFFTLKDHIQACLDTFSGAKRQYGPMLQFFEERNQPNANIEYLQISDYNTRGMKYDPNNDACSFSAFVRGVGVHGTTNDESGRGGSFGLGKATFYKKSPFKTLFVSTFTEDNQYVFEGVSCLTTHKMNGVRYSHVGYYDNYDGFPITNEDEIPPRFLRKASEDHIIHTGTDIYIMGRDEAEGDVENIIQSVLVHYWLSVMKGKLVVKVINRNNDEWIIDSNNLDDLMKKNFPSPLDNGNKDNVNPRPYYNAVAYVEPAPGMTCIKKHLPLIGDVELYLSKNREANSDRITCFRMPCMMVMRRSSSQLGLGISSYGVYGVFVCTDAAGDKLLKKLENPAHDEWDAKNWTDPITSKVKDDARQVMKELTNFLRDEIEAFCKTKGKASLKMLGAGKYLYTLQDFVEQSDTDYTLDAERSPIPETNFSEEETGHKGIYSNPDVDINIASKPIGMRPGNIRNTEGKATPDSKKDKPGKTTAFVTPAHKPEKSTKKTNKGGDKEVTAHESDKSAVTKEAIEYKVYANKENGVVIHNICIRTSKEIESALIQFIAYREDGKIENDLKIADSFGLGNCKGLELSNVPLKVGDNFIKVRFNDNIKHALRVNLNLKK